MKPLAAAFLVLGLVGVAFGLGSCYRILNPKTVPDTHPMGWDSEGSNGAGFDRGRRFFCVMAGGVLALSVGGFLYGRTKKLRSSPKAEGRRLVAALVAAVVMAVLFDLFMVIPAFIATWIVLSTVFSYASVEAWPPAKQRAITWLVAAGTSASVCLMERLFPMLAR